MFECYCLSMRTEEKNSGFKNAGFLYHFKTLSRNAPSLCVVLAGNAEQYLGKCVCAVWCIHIHCSRYKSLLYRYSSDENRDPEMVINHRGKRKEKKA